MKLSNLPPQKDSTDSRDVSASAASLRPEGLTAKGPFRVLNCSEARTPDPAPLEKKQAAPAIEEAKNPSATTSGSNFNLGDNKSEAVTHLL